MEAHTLANKYFTELLPIIQENVAFKDTAERVVEFKNSKIKTDINAEVHISFAVFEMLKVAAEDLKASMEVEKTKDYLTHAEISDIKKNAAIVLNAEWSLHTLYPEGPLRNPYLQHWTTLAEDYAIKGDKPHYEDNLYDFKYAQMLLISHILNESQQVGGFVYIFVTNSKYNCSSPKRLLSSWFRRPASSWSMCQISINSSKLLL